MLVVVVVDMRQPFYNLGTPGIWGSSGALGKPQGSSFCHPASLPGQESTQWDRAVFKAALGLSCVFRAFPGPT